MQRHSTLHAGRRIATHATTQLNSTQPKRVVADLPIIGLEEVGDRDEPLEDDDGEVTHRVKAYPVGIEPRVD